MDQTPAYDVKESEAGEIVGDFTTRTITFPLLGKTLFVVKADGTIERGDGFTTEDEASLHFWLMLEMVGLGIARERKVGAHVLATAKSLGWKDDGEGALEFLMRRTREVALEDAKSRT